MYADLLKTNTTPVLWIVRIRHYEFGAPGSFVVSESCPSNWLGVEQTAFNGEQDNHDALIYVRSVIISDDNIDPNKYWPDTFPEMLIK